MTYDEVMAFANEHTDLIGKQFRFRDHRCTVLRIHVVNELDDNYIVNICLFVEEGFEVETHLDSFLKEATKV